MHHKFAVVDGAFVWTGSYNLTPNGARKTTTTPSRYTPRSWRRYSRRIHGDAPRRRFRQQEGVWRLRRVRQKISRKIGNTDINAYFSPDDNIERIILKRLAKAERSVRFMAFSFTSDPLGEEMVRLHKKGVDVRGVMEKTGTNGKDSEYVKMTIEGIPVKIISGIGRMHHKVMIIDDSVVITGSFNFSRGANARNDENILIIRNEEIARAYSSEFTRLYAADGGAARPARAAPPQEIHTHGGIP
jgi:phosphatidylserine/phosphatidylglycerophosphate/cardiolipin synthase-like enzyme